MFILQLEKCRPPHCVPYRNLIICAMGPRLRKDDGEVTVARGDWNPFLHLRLGQAQLELKNEVRAAEELCRAYMGAGKEIFAKEDPKYFDFLKTKISPPSSGLW